jgi:hypothetical protein
VNPQLAGVLVTVLMSLMVAPHAHAQDERRAYAGGLVGIATLSADATTSTSAGRADVALYKPENGPALNLFAGLHVRPYVTIQANYVWNRNDVTLFSSVASAGASGFFEQRRDGDQHAVIADALLYFRRRGDAIRPYLSTGVGMVRFQSEPGRTTNGGLSGPEGELSSTRVALRVAVGIDLAIRDAWSFRYSFSETISGNPISTRLTPPGERNLANFQNLFGIVRRF